MMMRATTHETDVDSVISNLENYLKESGVEAAGT